MSDSLPRPDQQLRDWIAAAAAPLAGSALVVGICGAQGSGKTRLAAGLSQDLQALGLRVCCLSLDDLYLRRRERLQLAATIHPLLATRGVPGTHDVAMGTALLAQLKCLPVGAALALPRFDKARDDRALSADADTVTGPLDVILFEGWCVGLPPQCEAELARPVNQLEREQDADGRWRAWVNQQLASDYAALFAAIDRLIFLAVPDWEAVLQWRSQQERETAAAAPDGGVGLMDEVALRQFIAHYERLSRHALQVMPSRADLVRRLGWRHEVLEQCERPAPGHVR